MASLREWLIGASLVLLGVVLGEVARRVVKLPTLAVQFPNGWGVESEDFNVCTVHVWNHSDAAALGVRVYARLDGEEVAEQRGVAISPTRLRLSHFASRADSSATGPTPLRSRAD